MDRVIVYIEGGAVQWAASDNPNAELLVIDGDQQGDGDYGDYSAWTEPLIPTSEICPELTQIITAHDGDEKANVLLAIKNFSEHIEDLLKENPDADYRLLLHVWSGSNFNEFYPIDNKNDSTHIEEAIKLYKERIEVEGHSRLYIEIDCEGNTVLEDGILFYPDEETA